ncbi:MAG: hypothetical protein ACREBF_00740 [Candidatus Micrarchaeales archaeon]
MKNIAVLSHNADIDGVGAASLLKIKYNIPSNRLFFSGYAKEGILYAEGKLKKFYGKDFVLFITDLSLNDPTILVWMSLIKRIKAKGGKVFWFDHHPWSEKAIKKVASLCDVAIVGENAKFCATEITQREMQLDTPFVREFCKVVHYSDFNIKADTERHREMVKVYALSITTWTKSKSNEAIQKKLRHITEVIASRRFTDSRMTTASRNFEKLNNMRVEKMLAKLTLVGRSIAVGYATGVQSTYACGMVIKKSGRDIAIVIDPKQGKGSIRSVKSDISGLAKSLSGGGHPHASGFEIDLKKYPLNSEAGRTRLMEKISMEASKL